MGPDATGASLGSRRAWYDDPGHRDADQRDLRVAAARARGRRGSHPLEPGLGDLRRTVRPSSIAHLPRVPAPTPDTTVRGGVGGTNPRDPVDREGRDERRRRLSPRPDRPPAVKAIERLRRPRSRPSATAVTSTGAFGWARRRCRTGGIVRAGATVRVIAANGDRRRNRRRVRQPGNRDRAVSVVVPSPSWPWLFAPQVRSSRPTAAPTSVRRPSRSPRHQ
jgi:hypothetical protein